MPMWDYDGYEINPEPCEFCLAEHGHCVACPRLSSPAKQAERNMPLACFICPCGERLHTDTWENFTCPHCKRTVKQMTVYLRESQPTEIFSPSDVWYLKEMNICLS